MRKYGRRLAAFGFVVAGLSLCSSPAFAQSKYIKNANAGYVAGGLEGETVLLSALNLCDVPLHVTMRIVDGITGDPLGASWDADVPVGRAAHLDVVLGVLTGGAAHRVWGEVEVSPPASAETPSCLRGRNVPVSGQLEIVSPGGARLLLPAVQKVRIAAAR